LPDAGAWGKGGFAAAKNSAGSVGVGIGSGGSGGYAQGSSANGAAGTNGIVIVEW
jgi:hypothetical protein